MKRLLMGVLTLGAATVVSAQTPLWDLTKDEIPADLKHGNIEKVNGVVTVGGDNYFGVPAAAFPDGKNFTVQATVKFPELADETMLNLFLKQRKDGEDTGFGLSCINGKNWKVYRPIVNGMHIGGIGLKFQPDTPYTFTVTAKNGILAYYLNDNLGSRHFTMLIPNDEPLWIGKKLLPKEIPFKAAEISSLKVYGADFNYVSPKEKVGPEPRGAIAGKNWVLDTPTIVDPNRPKILFYGDSISGGYRGYLLPALEGKVYAYHWCSFINGLGGGTNASIKEGAGAAKFDVIFFNNGLHSLHWTPEKATDQQIYDTTRALVRGFKEGAPQAKLFWIATTPQTARRPAPGKAVEALGDKNAIVLRINRIAEKVMKDEDVEVIDMYTPLAARLDLAAGDEYHWSGPAYKMISDAVVEKTMETLRKDGKLK